jgi:hypothetical protein
MEFSVEFYETEGGGRPVREFLDALKASDPGDFAAVLAGLAKLRNRRIIAVHGIRNKGQAIQIRDLAIARERMRDWQKREPK